MTHFGWMRTGAGLCLVMRLGTGSGACGAVFALENLSQSLCCGVLGYSGKGVAVMECRTTQISARVRTLVVGERRKDMSEKEVRERDGRWQIRDDRSRWRLRSKRVMDMEVEIDRDGDRCRYT